MKKLLAASIILFAFHSANLFAAPLQLTDLQNQRNTLSAQLQKLDDIGRQIDAARGAKSQAELDIQTQEDALRKAKAKLEKFQTLNRDEPGTIPDETVRAVERENASAYKALQAAKAALIKADAAINSGNVAATKQTAEVQRQQTAFERNVSQLTETEVQQRIKAMTVSKTVKVTERVSCGEDTLPRCKERAKQAATQKATEQGSTIFLNSSTEVRNFKLTQEQIRSEVSAALSNIEFSKVAIIDESAEATLTATVTPTISASLREQLTNTVREEIYAALGGKLASVESVEAAPAPQAPQAPQAGRAFKDCADCPELVVIPAGSFNMGSPDSETGRYGDEGPLHRVTIGKPFAMGKFEVTQAQWQAVMGSNPSSFKNCGENCPVENVSWNDVQEFIRKLNQKTGKNYRLPTEAEWEYAARAGSQSAYPWGNQASHEYANYGIDECCGELARGRDQWVNTSPAGSFAPNAFGLYDMIGNVYEWVQDSSHDNYAGAPNDGSEWQGDGAKRVLRGGSWDINAQNTRAANRNFNTPAIRINYYGFRLARTLP